MSLSPRGFKFSSWLSTLFCTQRGLTGGKLGRKASSGSVSGSPTPTYRIMASDLERAALVLAIDGPVKHEPSPRRIRVLLNGVYIFDTTSSLLVWEHPNFPQYYFPLSALKEATKGPAIPINAGADFRDQLKDYTLHHLTVSGRATSPSPPLLAIHGAGPLSGYARLSFGRMQGWFEEDEPIHGHPRDPYKRVDVRASSRPVRVVVGGEEIARSDWAAHLYETTLPVRYYLPRTSVKWEMLRASVTRSYCPYKGWANYYDVVLPKSGEVFKDIVWYYETPLVEVAGVRDLVCFYNEKVDIWLDGQKLERPKTHFA